MLKTVDKNGNAHNKRIYASLADVLTISCGACFSSSSRAEGTLLSDSSNNELLIINLATVRADGNSISRPA